ncbi:hypothetical protein LSH36_32g21001 [Paralvinella palmiformis]|uniref:Sorting nexin-17 n=1 Tax=Paralvinella palmiformis TaxID=53620 RepID=A0AAD9K8P1_9ANNE|nr:hypothetical protein LSH36_32g21001 [Paralvinella palmiformis]
MHFSIPDTSECTEKGATFTVFNLHINGAYHCSVRYRLFHSFHEQLKKEFGIQVLPTFPPKKLLSLSPVQLDERRAALERYIQVLSQNPQIASSETFNNFLLQAQQESQKEEPESVTLNVYMINGQKVSVNIISTDQTNDVLECVASEINLPDDLVYYFGLYLVHIEEDDELSIVRKLQEFESPYISLKAANQRAHHKIILRKSYWDPGHDDELMADSVTINLLYLQACCDVEKRWILATKEEHKQLDSLKHKGSKKEFPPCIVDYPHPGCRAIIAAGNKELNFRIEVERDVIKEVSFRVTRMRCWKITTPLPDSSVETESSQDRDEPQLELAFEYLIARDTMQWITIYSDQVIVISMCLQGMVDELVMKKEGRKFKKLSNGSVQSQKKTALPRSTSTDNELPIRLLGGRPHNNKIMSENYAFEGIGDDDL